MDQRRSPFCLLVSALGAGVVAVSVFLPWYALSSGVAARTGGAAAPGPGVSALQQFATVDGQHAFRYAGVILLVLAGLAMLDSLVPLATSASAAGNGAGGSVCLLGALGAVCVLYRLVDPPGLGGEAVTVSMRAGGWIALGGCVTMVLAGIWPRAGAAGERSAPQRAPLPRF